RVEAVGALREDLLDVVFLEGLDVLLREDLEEILVAHAAGGVPGAGFLLSEDCVVDARRVENPGQRLADLLLSLVVGARTADEPEVFELGVLVDGRNVVSLGPVRARGGAEAPRISLRLHPPEDARALLRTLALPQALVPSHLHDARKVFDEYGACGFAPAAGGAAPDRLRLDHRGNELGKLLAVLGPLSQHVHLLEQVLLDR